MSERDVLARERTSHDELYSRRETRWLDEPLTWDRYRATACVPPHEGGDIYGLDVRLYADRVASVLEQLPSSIRILEYGCGRAEMGVLAAKKGFSVAGFDLSPVSVKSAGRIAAQAGVGGRAVFAAANAQEIPFPANTFDLVLGKAVLHHVIKYAGTGTELARVMKPGGRALFLEGAAVNPLIRLARRFTIEEDLGDVPLTAAALQEWVAPFRRTEITGYFLFYMLKRLGFRGYRQDDWTRGRNWVGRSKLFDRFLSACLKVDELFVNERSWARRIAGRFLIVLHK